jgi:hypothetical protein
MEAAKIDISASMVHSFLIQQVDLDKFEHIAADSEDPFYPWLLSYSIRYFWETSCFSR